MFKFRNKSVYTAILVSLAAWLLPSTSFCASDDPYAYKSLVGRVTLEYERETTTQNDFKFVSNRFEQKYSLDMRGYFINRRLLIYDASLTYINSDYNSDTTNTNASISNYYLSTTALPLSAIPLTLYTRRQSSTITSATETTNTRNTYGLRWKLWFKTLPETLLEAETSQNESSGATNSTDIYRVTMEKDIGPTENDLRYLLTNTSGAGTDSSSYSLNFNNDTTISKNTTLRLGATRGESDSSDSSAATVTGLSLSLISSPSQEFYQTHSYNYYNSETGDSSQAGNLYSGSLKYDFSSRLKSSLGLSVNNNTNESGTSASTSESLTSNMTLSYRMTNTLQLLQSAAYSRFETNSTDLTAGNLSDRETLRTLTSILYKKNLNWALLSTTAGLGYVREKRPDDYIGQALAQHYNIYLSNIDLNKYVGANAQLRYSQDRTISGNNVDSSSLGYNLSMYNKMWREYVDSNVNYSKSINTTYRKDLDNERETYGFKATSKYFKKTQFKVFARHSNTFQELVGSSQNTSMGLGAKHQRSLFKGNLQLALNYVTTESSFKGGSDSATNLQYSLHYSKMLLRNISWDALAQRNEQKSSNTFTNTTYIRNRLLYPLRSWQFSLEYDYRNTENTISDIVNTTLLFKASRTFVRAW